MKTNKTGRRDFIKKSAVASAGLAFSFSAKSYGNILGANDRVNFAVIGLHGRGKAHIAAINALQKEVKIAAICDVDKNMFGDIYKSFPNTGIEKIKTEQDFRRVLDNKNIDAITVATPDHWHTPMGILAMQAGKNVYLEKPPCHNPAEGLMLIESQKKEGKILQIGNQQRSAPTSIQAVKDIRNGIIGDVYFAKCWYSNTRGSIGRGKVTPVPENLDWDLWQGPAPRMSFKDNYVHYNWHWFWNWGTGEANNNGLHELDICRWALGVDIPNRTTSTGGRYHFNDDWEFYDTQEVTFEYDNNKMITWEGKSCNGFPYFDRGRGSTIHGTKGTILIDRNSYILYDLQGKEINRIDEEKKSETTNTVGMGNLDILHMNNFVNAIQNGEKLNSPIETAYVSNLLCHLGNIAQKTNSAIFMDSEKGIIKENAEAQKLWGRSYEQGWEPKI